MIVDNEFKPLSIVVNVLWRFDTFKLEYVDRLFRLKLEYVDNEFKLSVDIDVVVKYKYPLAF